MADKSIFFVTHKGRLYRITPAMEKTGSRVEDFGFIHPTGSAYTPALFSCDGKTQLVSINRPDDQKFEWIVYDIATKKSEVLPLEIPAMEHTLNRERSRPRTPLLYGCNTRDNAGAFYIVGSGDNHYYAYRLKLSSPGKE